MTPLFEERRMIREARLKANRNHVLYFDVMRDYNEQADLIDQRIDRILDSVLGTSNDDQ